jgi:hypothetical protein
LNLFLYKAGKAKIYSAPALGKPAKINAQNDLLLSTLITFAKTKIEPDPNK